MGLAESHVFLMGGGHMNRDGIPDRYLRLVPLTLLLVAGALILLAGAAAVSASAREPVPTPPGGGAGVSALAADHGPPFGHPAARLSGATNDQDRLVGFRHRVLRRSQYFDPRDRYRRR